MTINKKDFETLRKTFDTQDAIREMIIKGQRDVIKQSKSVIYSVHRGKIAEATKEASAMQVNLKKLVALTKKHPAMYYSGTIKVAEQEVVEAIALLAIAKDKAVPTCASLGVNEENYLLGICDLFGELSRRATNTAIKEQYKETMHIIKIAGGLYEELMRFDFRNSELRRKFDATKYELKKLEALALELHLGGKA